MTETQAMSANGVTMGKQAKGAYRFRTTATGVALAGSLLASGAFAPVVAAEQNETDPLQTAQAESVSFNIPAQSLAEALGQFSEQSGLFFAFKSEDLAGLSTRGVSGEFVPDEALRRLLAGTGVTFDFADATTVNLSVVIVPAEGSGPVRLGTIQVTGERVARSLQQTTSSVTVYDEETIGRRDNSDVQKLIGNAPNVVLGSGGTELPTIRGGESSGPAGLQVNAYTSGQPRAAVIVDDVAVQAALTNNTFQNLFDAEQVEVLRGPQTSNRGSNAIDGAIVIKTKDPVHRQEYELKIDASYDRFSAAPSTQTSAMANVPILQDQVATRVVVGFDNNQLPIRFRNVGASAVDESRFDLSRLGEEHSFNLRNKWLLEPEAIPGLSMILTGKMQNARDTYRDGIIDDGSSSGRSIDERIALASNAVIYNTRDKSLALDTSYDFGSDWKLRSLTAWQRHENWGAVDSQTNNNFRPQRQTKFDQEFLLDFGGDQDDLSGLFGVSYQWATNYLDNDGTTIEVDGIKQTISVFADTSYRILPPLRLLLGGRFMQYKSRNDILVNTARTSEDLTENRFLPKIGLSYDLTDEQTISVTGRRGYNPGGVMVNLGNTIFDFNSETVDTAEITYRGQFDGGRYNVNLTGFYNDYKNRQLYDGTSPFNFFITNAQEANSYGLELEGSALVLDDFQISGGLGLLRTEIEKYQASRAVEGNDFGNDPDLTASFSLVWFAMDDLELNFDGNYVSPFFADYANDDQQVGNYWLFDVGLAYTYEALTARAYVRNIFNELAKTSNTRVLDPRTFGASLSVKF